MSGSDSRLKIECVNLHLTRLPSGLGLLRVAASSNPVVMRLAAFQEVAPKLRYSKVWSHSVAVTGARKSGVVAWADESHAPPLYVAWEWASLDNIPVCLVNPMEFETNIVLVDDGGHQFGTAFRVSKFNWAIYSWQWWKVFTGSASS